MEEPTTVTTNIQELILDSVKRLEAGQTEIKEQLATHEERSQSQHKRIERIEKGSAGIAGMLLVALLGVAISGCGIFGALTKAPPQDPTPAAPKVDVVKRAVQNTVALHTVKTEEKPEMRYCSGVAAAGAILTAAHCTSTTVPFQVQYKGKMYPGVIIYRNDKTDFAIVDAVGARIQDDVPLATKSPSLGNKVIWMGYPLGEDFHMGTGIVSNPSVSLGQGIYMAIYGQFIPGNSGGPVFNYKGELIGIISMTMTYNNNYLPVGFAVPLSVINAAL
jgi:S1-C subfamily serine protease